MKPSDTDENWEVLGETNPYWAVMTSEKFKNHNLSNEVLQEFFDTGEKHVDRLFRIIKRHIDPNFQPSVCLDFGCGVGRVALPLAKRVSKVTGVDVAKSMLEEARVNCERFKLTNVTLDEPDAILADDSLQFDFIHSFIVLQHIMPERGEQYFRKLVEHLKPGGVGALHVVYSNRKGTPRADAPRKEPVMMMNSYNLNTLVQICQESPCNNIYIQLAPHGDCYSSFLFFQKQKPA